MTGSRSQIDPELQPALDQMKQALGSTSLDFNDLNAARQIHAALTRQAIDESKEIPGMLFERQSIHDVDLDIDVRVETYRPASTQEVLPAILYIHGGGYVSGTADQAQAKLAEWAASLKAFVVSVDYRLAPEHPFPAGLHDCFAVLRWLFEYAGGLHLDPHKIIVAGDSAGGGLAAGLALYARDHSEIPIAMQLLVYPMLDHTNVEPADNKRADTVIWSRENNRFGWQAYLGSGVEPEMMPYAVPATADNLYGLPPAFIPVGDQDLFLRENQVYAERLRESGVEAECRVYPGGYHAFANLAPEAAVSRKFTQDIHQALRTAISQ